MNQTVRYVHMVVIGATDTFLFCFVNTVGGVIVLFWKCHEKMADEHGGTKLCR